MPFNPQKWFDRRFDFGFDTDKYGTIYERLQLAPGKCAYAVASLPEEMLVYKPEGRWSIKEHIGHLSLIESLWRTRFNDIREKRPELTPADLDNKATSEAGFNAWTIPALVEKFIQERSATLALLDNLDEKDVSKTSLHPRLLQPMRIIDLAYFVAEHDDHHLAAIRDMPVARGI